MPVAFKRIVGNIGLTGYVTLHDTGPIKSLTDESVHSRATELATVSSGTVRAAAGSS